MQQKTFYLSFDGSPHPPATDRLLNALESYNIKACFLYGGQAA